MKPDRGIIGEELVPVPSWCEVTEEEERGSVAASLCGLLATISWGFFKGLNNSIKGS